MHDIFYFTDIHGAGALFDAIMAFCEKEDPEAMIIFGGDACDRGPDGYRIIKSLLDNPQVVYLKGNHEDMLTRAMRELKSQFSFASRTREDIRTVLNACRHFDYKYEGIQNSLHNGSMDTLLDWIEDGMPMEICERLEKLPLTLSTELCDFCHSGSIYKAFKEIAEKEYYGKPIPEWDTSYVLWSRNSLDAPWVPGRTAVFGHTPVPFLPDYVHDMKLDMKEKQDVRPVKWGDPATTGEKIDMDTGAVFLGRAYVLNVLTMQATGFEDKDFKNKEIHKHDVEQIEVIQF